uniref:Zinc finger protein with KRAB and SCAN domains 2 n=1 Tax=Anthurium amnicola TaxID=1678845 RepID=A0A1D1Z1T2_9ARAE
MTPGGVEEAAAAHAAPPRKQGGPGPPWLDRETAELIDNYEERWYALKRGQLKAHQWEEVAAAVAARLGHARPSKSGTQCRHKIEKLRQRYRAERQRPAPSRWAFFDRMDRMERGPLPISVRPPPALPPPPQIDEGVKEDEGEEKGDSDDGGGDDDESSDDGAPEDGANCNTRSINGILSEENLRYPKISRWGLCEEEGKWEGEAGPASQLAAAVRRFREGFLRLEKRRLELMMEMERDWMEMETKRAEMVVESQRRLADTIAKAFHFTSAKKPKKAHEM